MKKIVRLTESDLTRLVKRIIQEQDMHSMLDGLEERIISKIKECASKYGIKDLTKFENCSKLVGNLLRGKYPTEKEMKDCENELVKNGFNRKTAFDIHNCVNR